MVLSMEIFNVQISHPIVVTIELLKFLFNNLMITIINEAQIHISFLLMVLLFLYEKKCHLK